jgi:hypothetical protein
MWVGESLTWIFLPRKIWLDRTVIIADIVRFAHGGVEGCNSHRRCPPPPVAFRLR